MKKIFGALIIIIPMLLSASPIKIDEARIKAEQLISVKMVENQVNTIQFLEKNAAFLAILEPVGFILLSTDSDLHPIIGYSFIDNFTEQPEELTIISSWLQNVHDSYLNDLAAEQRKLNRLKWNTPLAVSTRFEQWPPAGTTPTGGWLETNWSQGYPYNQFCPIDPTNGSQCVAGCPSIVMSQILNYHHQINQTQFSDDDDYHMYNSGNNNYIIDDDAHVHNFPTWVELNSYLNSIEALYAGHNDLTDELKGALVFACGAAIQQVYSSSISGNYYDQQIINGFRRFGFDTTELLWEEEPLVFTRLAENMKAGLPARLGILSDSAGHQIVVDGYNTDEEYHFNFGWGGGSNGWYSFPLSGMPYQLNIFGSVDIDINQTWDNCPDFEITSPLSGSVFAYEEFVPVEIVETGATPIDSISFFIDNELYQTSLYPTTCSLLMSILDNGNHKLTVAAYAEDKKLRAKTLDFEIARGNVIFAENFDGSWENNWEVFSSNNDHTWQILENSLESFSETSSSNISSATCPLAYANLSEVMISPEIDLPVADELFWNFYVGFCDRYPSYPAIIAAISNDGGNTWNDLWQTSTTIEEWTWKFVSLNLADYSGQTIMIKYTCSGFSYADVSIDGIRIIETVEVEAGNELLPAQIALSNYPNPFNPITTISFDLNTSLRNASTGQAESSENTELIIYNLRGQKVKDLSPSLCHTELVEVRGENRYSLTWNGTDDNNKPVSSGIYFAKLRNGNQQVSRKMLLIK